MDLPLYLINYNLTIFFWNIVFVYDLDNTGVCLIKIEVKWKNKDF
jgi:hypothetical protein